MYTNTNTMKTIRVIKIIELLNKYPIEMILAKQFILSGVKNEQELQNLLKSNNKIPVFLRLKIQNAYRDIELMIININDIPDILK
jgi:hypothetical protein